MDRMTMSHDELIEAVQKAFAAAPNPDGAMTTMQIALVLDRPREWVLKAIGRLIEAGVVEPIHVRRADNWGVIHKRPGIRLKRSSP